MHRILRATAALAAATLVLTACAPRTTVTVPYTQDEATVPVGGTLVVDLGTVSSSIGDAWALTTAPDPTVLGEGSEHYAAQGDADGAYAGLTWEFEALAPGTTTVGFTYSYRGEAGDPEGRTQDPEPLLVVTVTG